MEQTAVILLIVTALSAILETGFYRKMLHVIVFAIACGIIAFAFYPLAIQQTNKILQNVLSDRRVLLNIAAILTIENLVFIGVNFFQLQRFHGEASHIKPWLKILIDMLTYFPGFIFFGSLFYFEVQVFLLGLPLSFPVIATIIAFSIIIIIIFGNALMKKVLPEKNLRLELNYFLRLLQIIMATVVAADAAPNVRLTESVGNNWAAVMGVFAIGAVIGFIGFISYFWKIKKR